MTWMEGWRRGGGNLDQLGTLATWIFNKFDTAEIYFSI